MADLTNLGFWRRVGASLGLGSLHLDRGSNAGVSAQAVTPSGTEVSAQRALRLSAVWACVRLRAETVSTLPLHLRTADGGTANGHDLYRLLHDAPNADMCAAEFWQAMTAALDLWGNAFARIHRNGAGAVVALEPVDAEAVEVRRLESGSLAYCYRKNGRELWLSEADVLHFRGFSLDGLKGLSPIAYAAQTLGAQMEANDAASHEFKNKLKAGGFLKTGERVLQPQQRERLREALTEFARPDSSGRYMVLEAGMDVVGSGALKLNPADAQLLESRYFGIEEICRAFGVPPQLIGHTDKASSWASSLDGVNMGFLTYSIRPTLVRFEQTLARKLLKPAERGALVPRFSVEGLLRTDSGARAAFYSQMLQNGVFSRNYVRQLENLPPVEGGDVLTVQVNLTTLDKVGVADDAKAVADAV